jgi:hypothetical protein
MLQLISCPDPTCAVPARSSAVAIVERRTLHTPVPTHTSSHVVLGRRDGATVGGHLLGGAVWSTLEVLVTEVADELAKRIDGLRAARRTRRTRDQPGKRCWSPHERRSAVEVRGSTGEAMLATLAIDRARSPPRYHLAPRRHPSTQT